MRLTALRIQIPEVLSDEFLDSLADRTVGFSGRQLSKFVFGLQAAVFGSGLSVV